MTIKSKKQFRLFDIYRYLALGEESNIKGIKSYVVTKSGCIQIQFHDNIIVPTSTFFYNNEKELHEIVKQVNKALNNCDKPGKKAIDKTKRQNGCSRETVFNIQCLTCKYSTVFDCSKYVNCRDCPNYTGHCNCTENPFINETKCMYYKRVNK